MANLICEGWRWELLQLYFCQKLFCFVLVLVWFFLSVFFCFCLVLFLLGYLQYPPLVPQDHCPHVTLVACRDHAVHLLEKLHQSLYQLITCSCWDWDWDWGRNHPLQGGGIVLTFTGAAEDAAGTRVVFIDVGGGMRPKASRIPDRGDCRWDRGRGSSLTYITTRHLSLPLPPRGKGGVPQNAPRFLLGISQLEAQDSVDRLDVEELVDCQTELVRHHFECLVVRQTAPWLLQQHLRNARGTRRRPEGMVVVGTGHLDYRR